MLVGNIINVQVKCLNSILSWEEYAFLHFCLESPSLFNNMFQSHKEKKTKKQQNQNKSNKPKPIKQMKN